MSFVGNISIPVVVFLFAKDTLRAHVVPRKIHLIARPNPSDVCGCCGCFFPNLGWSTQGSHRQIIRPDKHLQPRDDYNMLTIEVLLPQNWIECAPKRRRKSDQNQRMYFHAIKVSVALHFDLRFEDSFLLVIVWRCYWNDIQWRRDRKRGVPMMKQEEKEEEVES